MRLHWTFLVLVGLVAFGIFQVSGDLRGTAYAVGMFLGIFMFVLVHELAHVATARRFGVKTKSITLHPLGGISMMESIPENPKQEALVAVAGPLVNVVAAVLLVPVVIHFHGASSLWQPRLLDLSEPTLFLDLFWLNIIMGAFNLLPAFPLDGGRVMRASLATRMPYPRATRIAANMGRLFGIFLALVGIVYNFWFILIGIFIYFGAAAEERMAMTMSLFEGATVREAMSADFYTVRPDVTAPELLDMRYQTGQLDVPVVENERYLGMIDRERITNELHHSKETAADLMDEDAPTLEADEDLGVAFRRFASTQRKALAVLDADDNDAGDPAGERRRIQGLVTIEDMERAYLSLQQRQRYGGWGPIDRNEGATRTPAPAQPRPSGPVPQAHGTRVRSDSGDDVEQWYPVGR